MTKKDTSGAAIAANAPAGLVVTDGEAAEARHDGALDAIKDAAKDARIALTDGAQPGEPASDNWAGHDEIQQYADILDLGVGAFEDMASDKDSRVPDAKWYGLLALERNGKNRTPYVKAMMSRLGLKADELPGGGPAYTNDVTNITDL